MDDNVQKDTMSRCDNITQFEKDIYKAMLAHKIDGHAVYARIDRVPGSDKNPYVLGPFAFIAVFNPHDPKLRSLAVSYKGAPYVFLCRFAIELP